MGDEKSGRRNGDSRSGEADGDRRGEDATTLGAATGNDGKSRKGAGGGAMNSYKEAARVYPEDPGLTDGEICAALQRQHAEKCNQNEKWAMLVEKSINDIKKKKNEIETAREAKLIAAAKSNAEQQGANVYDAIKMFRRARQGSMHVERMEFFANSVKECALGGASSEEAREAFAHARRPRDGEGEGKGGKTGGGGGSRRSPRKGAGKSPQTAPGELPSTGEGTDDPTNVDIDGKNWLVFRFLRYGEMRGMATKRSMRETAVRYEIAGVNLYYMHRNRIDFIRVCPAEEARIDALQLSREKARLCGHNSTQGGLSAATY